MEKKEVVFDGKNLSFPIDGVMIVNGELPSTFEIKESYLIDKDSLAKLIVACGKGIALKEHEVGYGYSRSTVYTVYSSEDAITLFTEENDKLRAKNDRLIEESDKLRAENVDLIKRNKNFEDRITKHNASNWINRIRKIKEE